MRPDERRAWGVILAFLLLAGLAGLLLPLALFPELRVHYDTIVEANESRVLWPDGGLPKAIVLVLLLPAVSLLLLQLDRAIAALFALRPPRGR